MAECAMVVALSVALDLLPLPRWPQGGSLSVAMVPIIYYSYRAGTGWGLAAGMIHSVVQMLMGFYLPPANTVGAIVLCILLDYVLAFSVFGMANVFARLAGPHRTVGYGIGALTVSLLRYLFSALSGAILWGSYAPEGVSVWAYTFAYNGSYMIPNAVLATVLMVLLCLTLDPRTLRTRKKSI